MIEALASISGLSTLALVGVVVWLVYKSFAAKDSEIAAARALDKEREEHRATRGELQVEEAAHTATRDLLKKEQDLRSAAEAQRNQAMRRVGELLAAHMEEASNDDITAIVHDLFAGFPGAGDAGANVANRVPAPLPDAGRAKADDTALEKPGV